MGAFLILTTSMINLFFNLGNFSSQSLSNVRLDNQSSKNEIVFITCEPLSVIKQVDLISGACRYLERHLNKEIYSDQVVTYLKTESIDEENNYCIKQIQFQIYWD